MVEDILYFLLVNTRCCGYSHLAWLIHLYIYELNSIQIITTDTTLSHDGNKGQRFMLISLREWEYNVHINLRLQKY